MVEWMLQIADHNGGFLSPIKVPFRGKVSSSAAILLISVALASSASAIQKTEAPQAPGAAAAKAVGTIRSISGNSVIIRGVGGGEATILIQDSTRMVRTAPGQKDLKGATPIQLQELQAGDRLLVRGQPAEDGKSIVALSAIVIKGADIAAKQQQEREDWQKRGIGGLVTATDPASGTITVSISGMGGSKTVAVHASKDTIVRRYAPDSVKFDDAKPAALDQIKTGDQLRARGTRSADGGEMTAEEIVAGTFRNIAGTVISADAANNSLSVQDLLTKKAVTVRINGDSQLHSLPPMVAQRIAMHLKGGGAEGSQNGAAPSQSASVPAPAGERTGAGNGRADFQQMLSRMPSVTLDELQKGAAVMIVATEGSASGQPTAVTLLTGVELILTAAPDSGKAAMLLSPWNLGGADAAGGNQ